MKKQRLARLLSHALSLSLLVSGVPRVEARRAGAAQPGTRADTGAQREPRRDEPKDRVLTESERAEEAARQRARALSVPVEPPLSDAAPGPSAAERARAAATASRGGASAQAAATFTVNSTGDEPDEENDGACATEAGVCTLRAAIQQANNSASTSTINFDIPGDGVRTINVGNAGLGPLPQVGSANINGYSQPGASPNTLLEGSNAVLLIELDGTNAGAGALGLDIAGGNSTVRGLVINRFKGPGVRLIQGGGNKVQGCFIGTDTAGTADLGNTSVGVFILFSSDNTIGGSGRGDRNVISGNNLNGIQILGGGTGNTVVNNYIGTSASGDADLGNMSTGIAVFSSAPNNITGNVISGNDVHGIQIIGNSDTAAINVQNNRIGTSANGTAGLGNALAGVVIFDSNANTLADNLISGNDLHGVAISGASAANTLRGNRIGTDLEGDKPLGNSVAGVALFSSGNFVGGTTDRDGNTISGNGLHGVSITGGASGNLVRGNHIGTDVMGGENLGNAQEGVAIFNSPTNTIGGPEPGAANTISGNGFSGVLISGPDSKDNVVVGNFIGTSSAGVRDIGNAREGVFIFDGASSNTVGGVGDLSNLIGGNDEYGIEIDGTGDTGTTANEVLSNTIGSVTGAIDLANRLAGVRIINSAGNFIGGPGAGEGNTIGLNPYAVEIEGTGATGNKVRGNTIRFNLLGGVKIFGGANGNTVGGVGPGEGNRILDNRGDGVEVIEAGATGNAILSNSIHSNSELGIDLTPPEDVNPNDSGDGDTGPNNLQNFPVLNTPDNLFGFTVITGTLDSTPRTGFRLEFFASPFCDISDQSRGGETFIGARDNVMTDMTGKVSFDFSVPTLPAGHFVTATATNTTLPPAPQNTLNNTSEYSRCVKVPTTEKLGVNTTEDTDDGACTPDNCSLREAILAANGDADSEIIDFAPGVGSQINLKSALPALAGNITINGPGADVLAVRRDAGGDYRIFQIENGSTVTISGLMISNGKVAGNGGGILNNGGSLMLANSTVSGNSADSGGGIFSQGGTLHVLDSTVSDNTAGGLDGNAPSALGPMSGGGAVTSGGGGIAVSAGVATITKSTTSGNFAVTKGGGILSTQSTLTVTNSTISGNSAAGPGGNDSGGGGLYSDGGALTITRSTVSGNDAAADGGGVKRIGGAAADLRSTIVADNSAGGAGPELSGAFNSLGLNLFESTGGATITGATASDLTGVDPKLAPLADNGGPTRTHALETGSPAIDKGDCGGSNTDQRGLPCPFDDPALGNASDGADVGAFELQTAGGPMSTPTPTPTPTPSPTPEPTPTPPAVLQFSQAVHDVAEEPTVATITVTRSGDTSAPVTVDYASSDGTASERSDYTTALGTLHFAVGDDVETFDVLINEDSFTEGTETVNLTLSNPSGGASLGAQATATLQIIDDPAEPPGNAIDDPAAFVSQHYRDFLNRQQDPAGQAFWTNEITSCGTDEGCRGHKRENVSAAFFVSIEFQGTGFEVIRIYKATFTDSAQRPRGLPRYREFLKDAQEIGRGVVVGVSDWERRLAANMRDFARGWVQRPEVLAQLPDGMTGAEFVDRLFMNSGATPTPGERDAALAAFGAGGVEGRAAALLSVTASGSVYNEQFNCGFVLMLYFGYLHRNADDAPDGDFAGLDFWLSKLDSFSLPGEDLRDENTALGRVRRAEMVRAFLNSAEYRRRFGPP